MPGFILHLTAGKMLLDDTRLSKVISTKKDENMFLIGCVIPDASDRKRISHFRNTNQRGLIRQVPDLNLFKEKYGDRLNEPFFLGYMFHLYIDLRFFSEYLVKLVTFYDKYGNYTEYIKNGEMVKINKSNEIVSVDEYRSDEYYYGDYTRMNTYLIKKFNIPMDIFNVDEIPIMEEINSECIPAFFDKMIGYTNVNEDEIFNLKVFDIDDIIRYISEWTNEFVKKYLK